ncbi:uncharacterized protein LOC127792279 [Diospyros lotus]|uniref:uncharacterized protein LOC127792279 n=1 Tax=Diospyros lotus TaxID=55363 RepID=UPI002255CB03|nr:uncharacterized protein LOC127792279 [Diospyros lotus]
MKAAQDKQKSYADHQRRDLEFSIGDHVFLKVMLIRGVRRFGVSGKPSPCYVGPFKILEHIGLLAYRLALPPQLANVHNVFHVSMLRKYIPDPQHVIDFHPLELNEDMSYEESPSCILDHKEKVLRNRVIPYVKVLWHRHSPEEATWELEEEMKRVYPHLFEQPGFSHEPGMYYDYYVDREAMYVLQALMCMLHGITCIGYSIDEPFEAL